jgi:hypothetical protein
LSAKHRLPHPKRQRSTSELERRVRRLERHYMRDAASVATHVARLEITGAMREHLEEKHTFHLPSLRS